MKRLITLSMIVLFAISTFSLKAQMPELSTEGHEVWYYVLNQRPVDYDAWYNLKTWNPTNFALTGGAATVSLTASKARLDDRSQQWKVVEIENSGMYQLINRKTGLGAAGNDPAIFNDPLDNFYLWKLRISDGSSEDHPGEVFPGVRIISADGKVAMHASGGNVFHYDYEAPECYWVFTKVEAMPFNRPTKPIIYSTAENTVWYSIKNALRVDRNLLTDIAIDGTIMGTDSITTGSNDSQLWKVVSRGDGTVDIISKLHSGYIAIPTANSVDIPVVAVAQGPWTLGYLDKEQYNIIAGAFQLHLAGGRNLVAYPSSALGDGSCWLFNETVPTGTGMKNNANPNYKVYADNGFIKVTGTDLQPEILTITGLKADNKNRLSKGVYIVKLGTSSYKVFVN
ncbi:MAG TPA: hypothetical protein P5084_03245 [Paludibacter sp.]|nr:hypothetical protein [Paludibacter sp.]